MAQRMMGRLLSGLSALFIFGGAVAILVGALGPWAQVTLFHHIDLSLSGLLFEGGGVCLSVALLVLLGMRRSALLCLAAAFCALYWTGQARAKVPQRVKHQVTGAQMALYPLNSLLDQFHIDNVEIGGWTVPDPALLAPGLAWTGEGALALLLGAALGLPSDPVVRWVFLHTTRARCRACGARWLRARQARHCPQCGASALPRDDRRCPQCGVEAAPRDRHCTGCGFSLSR